MKAFLCVKVANMVPVRNVLDLDTKSYRMYNKFNIVGTSTAGNYK
jgi:hypothetical protein